MARHEVKEQDLRSDGRLTLAIEGRYRIHLQAAPMGRLAITATVLNLAERLSEPKTEQILVTVMTHAAGMLQKYPSSLCLDLEQEALLLQLTLPPSTEVEQLETELGYFASALGFWTQSSALSGLRKSSTRTYT